MVTASFISWLSPHAPIPSATGLVPCISRPGHDGPGRPRDLVGERHGRHCGGAAPNQSTGPGTPCVPRFRASRTTVIAPSCGCKLASVRPVARDRSLVSPTSGIGARLPTYQFKARKRDDGGLVGGDQIEIHTFVPALAPRRISPHQAGISKPGRSTAKAFCASIHASPFDWSCWMPRTPGSGNASWRAATVRHRFRRGRPGFRKCAAAKKMARLAAISQCASSASADAMGARCKSHVFVF